MRITLARHFVGLRPFSCASVSQDQFPLCVSVFFCCVCAHHLSFHCGTPCFSLCERWRVRSEMSWCVHACVCMRACALCARGDTVMRCTTRMRTHALTWARIHTPAHTSTVCAHTQAYTSIHEHTTSSSATVLMRKNEVHYATWRSVAWFSLASCGLLHVVCM